MASRPNLVDRSLFQLLHDSAFNEEKTLQWMHETFEKSPQSFRKRYLQLFVDCMQRDYELSQEDVREFIDSDLVVTIYNSKIRKSAKMNPKVSFSSFFCVFFTEAFVHNVLHEIVMDGMHFLMKFIEHEDIPDGDYAKGVCLFLVMAQLRAICENCDLEGNDDLDETLCEVQSTSVYCIESIMKLFKAGLDYEAFGVKVAEEFCRAMEDNREILIKTNDHIVQYFYLLQINDDAILLTALQSLNKLCQIGDIREDLLTLFYRLEVLVQGTDGSDFSVSVLDVLYQLTLTRTNDNVLKELLKLFIHIKAIDLKKNVLRAQQRVHIYKRTFSLRNKFRTVILIRMMRQYEKDNFYRTLLALIVDLNIKHEGIKWVVSAMDEKEIMPLLRAIFDHMNDNDSMANVSSQILFAVFNGNSMKDEAEFISKLDEILIAASLNEQVFVTVLDVILGLKEAKWTPMLRQKEVMRKKILIASVDIFSATHHPLVCKKTLKFMFKMEQLSVNVERCSRINFARMVAKQYEDFLEKETQSIIADNILTPSHETTVMKMSQFYRLGVKVYRDYYEYETIIVINEKHLANGDEDPLFYHYARLQTSILKFMFAYQVGMLKKIVKDENFIQFPLNIKEVVRTAANLREKLMTKLTMRNLSTYQASCLITSIVDLLYGFKCQPMIYNKTKILFIPQPRIPDFPAFVSFVEFYVFKKKPCDLIEGQMFNCHGYQIEIMESLALLCRSYSFSMDCTPLHSLIFHLGNDLYFKEIFQIVHVVSIKSNFPKIIGIILASFALHKVPVLFVTKFIQRIHSLKRIDVPDFKVQVCEYLIDSLEKIAKKPNSRIIPNRLLVLDYMTRFIGLDLTRGHKNKLCDLVQLAVADMTLSDHEEKTLVKFQEHLQYL